jgi:hypothetical protein
MRTISLCVVDETRWLLAGGTGKSLSAVRSRVSLCMGRSTLRRRPIGESFTRSSDAAQRALTVA